MVASSFALPAILMLSAAGFFIAGIATAVLELMGNSFEAQNGFIYSVQIDTTMAVYALERLLL
jgi:hypothetical protein